MDFPACVSAAGYFGRPMVRMGEKVRCGVCGGKHTLVWVQPGNIGLLYYQCGEITMLGAVGGRLAPGLTKEG